MDVGLWSTLPSFFYSSSRGAFISLLTLIDKYIFTSNWFWQGSYGETFIVSVLAPIQVRYLDRTERSRWMAVVF